MEQQTLHRTLNVEGVLPPKYYSRFSQRDEDNAFEYAEYRVQKYCHSDLTDKRMEMIKANSEDRKFLQILIYDEAHYSATSQTDATKRETPYSKLLNYINSEDYPNIIVLLITATPWNLLTVSSKVERTEVRIGDNGEPESCEGDLPYLEAHRKTPLHEIAWNQGYEGEYLMGKKIKLEVIISFQFEF